MTGGSDLEGVSGVPGVQTAFGLVPVCLDEGDGGSSRFGDSEADAVCSQMGHHCGMADREFLQGADEAAKRFENNISLIRICLSKMLQYFNTNWTFIVLFPLKNGLYFSRLSLLHDKLVLGLFATMDCGDGVTTENDATTPDPLTHRCVTVLTKDCPSESGAAAVCLDEGSSPPEDLELCKLLRDHGDVRF